MKRILSLLLVISLVFASLPASYSQASTLPTEPSVQVRLVNYLGNQTQITLRPSGGYIIDSTNQQLTSGKTYTLRVENGSLALFDGSTRVNIPTSFALSPTNYSNTLTINNRIYHGQFRFIVENGFVRPINTLLMEDYLKGVVPHEMFNSWHREALKVQAVAARTYAMTSVNKIIDDTINNQVYGGFYWYSNSTAAVNETVGEVLTFNGAPIGTAAVYSASNGGRTESNANAWGSTALSYLSIKEDTFDPKTPWTINLRKQQINLTNLDLFNVNSWWNNVNEADSTITTNIKRWLNQNGYQGKELKIVSIPKLTLHTVTSGGRASRGDITIEFFIRDKFDATGQLELQRLVLENRPIATIRSMIGLSIMQSYLIHNQTEMADTISVTGLGNGHGVGMSQWGAKNRADAGHSYRDILAFYYTGTAVVKRYDLASRVITVPEPAPTQPAPTQPAPTQPAPTQPAPTQPAPTQPAPTQPAPTQPAPTQPAPTQPVPTQPAPTQPAPTQPAPTQPAPTQPAPTQPAPTQPAPTQPTPKPVVDKTPPTVRNITSTIDYKGNNASISFNINEDANVTLRILDSKGKVVSTITSNQAVKAGTHRRSWNISKIANGSYTISIVAVDKSKNQSTTRGSVTVNKPRTGTVTATTLNVRATASTSGKRLGTLKRNQKVTIVSTSGNWHRITYGKGHGFVHKSYIK